MMALNYGGDSGYAKLVVVSLLFSFYCIHSAIVNIYFICYDEYGSARSIGKVFHFALLRNTRNSMKIHLRWRN